MKILYSPIGKSDPVCNCYDGPWLHSCRYTAPDLCVLFLTNDMCMREEQTKMYSRSAELMNRWFLDKEMRTENMQVEFRLHPEITNPQDSEQFYEVYEKELRELHDRYPDAEIYLNVRSGTPAMKMSLEWMFHTLPYKLVMCMTSMGIEDAKRAGSGSRENVPDDYDADEGWEMDLDNEECSRNRMTVKRWDDSTQLGTRLVVMQAKKLIEKKDFYAAKLMLEDIPRYRADQKLMDALDGAIFRQQWNTRNAGIKLGNAGWKYAETLRKYAEDETFVAAEACLTMKMALERNDIGDMLRRMTPVMLPMLKAVLRKTGINVDDFIYVQNDKEKISRDKLRTTCSSIFPIVDSEVFKEGSDTFLSDWQLIKILAANRNADLGILMAINKLRDVETEYRNKAAHTVKTLNSNKIDGNEILQSMISVFKYVDSMTFNMKYWKSMDDMAYFIAGLL